MPFIGTQPDVGGYSVLDNLTASATASYTLQKDSANFTPSSANQLLVSLNGVIQKPGTSFTVSGSTLTFSSALSSSDSIDFILAMGEPLLVGTPSDGAVNTTQLATNAVSSAKIASSAVTDAKIAGMAATKLTGTVSNARFPTGSIIQTSAMTQVNDLQVTINNSSSNTAITQMTTTITPHRASSRILVNLHTHLWAPSGQYLAVMIFRSVNGGSYGHTTSKPHAFVGNVNVWQDSEITIIDSPTYTLGNSISYRPYVYTYNNSANTYFGWGSSGGGSATTMFSQEIVG